MSGIGVGNLEKKKVGKTYNVTELFNIVKFNGREKFFIDKKYNKETNTIEEWKTIIEKENLIFEKF
jgi:hypothetical protein